DVDGGGEGVVGRLRSVDVVVGVNIRAEAVTGQSGDHLIGVHVRRGSGSRLEHVDGEVVVVFAVGDLVGGGRDRLGGLGVEHPETCVHAGRGGFEQPECADLRALEAAPGYGVVLDGPLCLCPREGVGGDPDFANCVVLDAVFLFSHGHSLAQVSTPGATGRGTTLFVARFVAHDAAVFPHHRGVGR